MPAVKNYQDVPDTNIQNRKLTDLILYLCGSHSAAVNPPQEVPG